MKVAKAFWTSPNDITFVLSKDCKFIPKIEFANTDLKPVSVARTSMREFAKKVRITFKMALYIS